MKAGRSLLLISANEFDPAPWDTSTAHLWSRLSEGFDEVHVVARGRVARSRVARRGRVWVHFIPRLGSRSLSFLITQWLVMPIALRVRPSHIQVQSGLHGGPAAVLAGKVLRVPVLIEVHGEHYVRPGQLGSFWHRFLVRPVAGWAYRRATLVRSLAPQMTRELVDTYGDEVGRKIVEIPNRVNLGMFSPPKLGYGDGVIVRLVMVGALNLNKNQQQLIRDLEDAEFDGVLQLVGTGPAMEALRDQAASSRITVELLGQLSHGSLIEVLREADAYVHYSLSEAVPRAVLEAMSIGLPIIAGPAGFLDGVVVDGETGVRLRALNADNLRAALTRLGAPEAREQQGRHARRLVEQHFAEDAVFHNYFRVLASVSTE